ncbi:MAG: helix-turn-helix transcriptional regulator [Rhizobiaceae bacterium]|nr:helix-turn-helix transcriptional regulator [Rhizobiaceae bacterium]MCV0405833.1 helix-turn-helix transcriptional regulator [Rhizobiaceae bacterium]
MIQGNPVSIPFVFEQPCPIRDVLDRIGDQWTLLILEVLEHGTMRFSEIERAIPDISKQMLSKTLRRLEEDGFVKRTLYPEVPPRVDYELTDLGRSFLVPMKNLIAWANENHQAVCEARGEYRAKNGGR